MRLQPFLICHRSSPVAYKEVLVDDHGAGLTTPESINNPRYAVIEFNFVLYNGLVDITFTNDQSK